MTFVFRTERKWILLCKVSLNKVFNFSKPFIIYQIGLMSPPGSVPGQGRLTPRADTVSPVLSSSLMSLISVMVGSLQMAPALRLSTMLSACFSCRGGGDEDRDKTKAGRWYLRSSPGCNRSRQIQGFAVFQGEEKLQKD